MKVLSIRYHGPILSKTETYTDICKTPSIKFHDNPLSYSWVATFRQIDGQIRQRWRTVFCLPFSNVPSIYNDTAAVYRWQTKITCWVTDMTVSVRTSPPDLIRSTTCLCVAPSTVIPFLKENKQHRVLMSWTENIDFENSVNFCVSSTLYRYITQYCNLYNSYLIWNCIVRVASFCM
jgi:hypothetical protein